MNAFKLVFSARTWLLEVGSHSFLVDPYYKVLPYLLSSSKYMLNTFSVTFTFINYNGISLCSSYPTQASPSLVCASNL